MKIRELILASAATLIVCVAQTAGADLVTLVSAKELSPSNMIIPQSVNGMVTFKPCAGECDEDFDRARLTADSQFTINGRGMKFDDFRTNFAIIKGRKDSYALLSIDTRTNTVVSIQVEG